MKSKKPNASSLLKSVSRDNVKKSNSKWKNVFVETENVVASPTSDQQCFENVATNNLSLLNENKTAAPENVAAVKYAAQYFDSNLFEKNAFPANSAMLYIPNASENHSKNDNSNPASVVDDNSSISTFGSQHLEPSSI